MNYLQQIAVLAFLLIFTSASFAQGNKNIAPIWTFHDDSTNIHGVSIGLATFRSEPRNTNTNGVKIELIGAGILLGLGPRVPVAMDSSEFSHYYNDTLFSERINGISISPLGNVCQCKTNGIALSGWGQYNEHINGISANIFYNWAQVHNGIQVAFIFGGTYKLRGLQVSAVNTAVDTKGVQIGIFNQAKQGKVFQIGLWNINEKRKMPFINWYFGKK